jgi:Flp pilus assembly protein CpaB
VGQSDIHRAEYANSAFMVFAILLLLLASCGNERYRSQPTVRIPPGMRAVSILVHDISVAPGDHVDVLIIDKGQESGPVLKNVEVVSEPKSRRG